MKSTADTGRSSTIAPCLSVRPMTAPPGTPPPTRIVVQARVSWSRPPSFFTFGVPTARRGRVVHLGEGHAGLDQPAGQQTALAEGAVAEGPPHRGRLLRQVIGKTDQVGDVVVERPINAPTFMATIFKALGINPVGKLDYNGFAVPPVDGKAEPIAELF